MVGRSQASIDPPATPAARPHPRLRVKHDLKPIAHALTRHVAHQLILLRRSRRMTQPDMAELAGLAILQYTKYERGLTRLPADKMWLIATCLGLDVTYFFEGFDPGSMPDKLPRDDNAAIRLRIATALARITSARKLQSLIDLIRMLSDARDSE